MSTLNRKSPAQMAICQHCGHDLFADKRTEKTGYIFCSNKTCKYHDKPHPTGQSVNGKAA